MGSRRCQAALVSCALIGLLQVCHVQHQAQAFLFHQLEPITYDQSSEHGLYSSHNYSSGRVHHQPGHHRAASHNQHHVNNNNQAHLQQQHQQQQQRHQTHDITSIDAETDSSSSRQQACPAECHCNKIAQIADCSNRNLVRVPFGFPQDIKRIRLERNNITELGPYAFQGLKKLQRIDLSNNNLVKIDHQAFAGGLQSLNSLILYSNKLQQLPENLFIELSQLQLLLLNANSLQCIPRDLFQSLANLNLLSLYDNNIETIANGTFDGLKSIKTIHLGKNPLICDCNLAWLSEYLESNPVETSQAVCESPARNQAKRLSQLGRSKFKCEAKEAAKSGQISSRCAAASEPAGEPSASNCPAGCLCDALGVPNCSRAGPSGGLSSGSDDSSEPKLAQAAGSPAYELPDVPNDVPVYVTRIRINDNRIKRIRETGLFRRLANSQKLDLGNNKIIDIEDNAINGLVGSAKPERVVFVLVENDHCGGLAAAVDSQRLATTTLNGHAGERQLDSCQAAPRVNPPNFDSPCYNGGTCIAGITSMTNANYTCVCATGFTGPLCEINIDDCADHQCQNGAQCLDGVASYRCQCRDPTTSGEFCEQLNSPYATSSANSIAPLALPIIATGTASMELHQDQQQQQHYQQPHQQQVLARSADGFLRSPIELERQAKQQHQQDSKLEPDLQQQQQQSCRRLVQRKFYDDGNGCRSARPLKVAECAGSCETPVAANGGAQAPAPCCSPARVKRRRVRMVCNDGANYVKSLDVVKKCACSLDAAAAGPRNQLNATQEDQALQITRLDAVD